MNKAVSGIGEYVKPIFVAVLIGAISVIFLFVILAFVMSKQNIPSSAVGIISVICGSAGAFISGLAVSKIIRRRGFFFGFITGAVFSLLIMCAGALTGNDAYGPGFITKLTAVLASSSLGGILGVNSGK